MPSIAVQIADAMAAGLSTATFSAPYASIDATRRYVPDYDATELKDLQVSVVPGPAETEKGARGMDLFTHEIMVVVGKQVDGSNATIDALTLLCEEIIDAIRSETLDYEDMPEDAQYFASGMSVQFDRDSLTDRRIFLAQIDVSFRVPRPKLPAGPTVPGAPTITNAVAETLITWSAPESNGGSPITGYKLYVNGQWDTAPYGASDFTSVDGYEAGTVVRVSAVNAAGEGPQSAPVTVTA